MASITPIFRIFDYDKMIAFYIDWLGFKIDWEDRQSNSPAYLQISMGDILLHLKTISTTARESIQHIGTMNFTQWKQ